jgi:hypothetical protein
MGGVPRRTNLTNKIAVLTINNTVFAWQQPTITRVSTNQPRTLGASHSSIWVGRVIPGARRDDRRALRV